MNNNRKILMDKMAAKTKVIDELHNVSSLLAEATSLGADLKKKRLHLIFSGKGIVPMQDMANVLGISRGRIYQLLDESNGSEER